MKALLIATSLIFGLSAAAIGHAQAPAGAPAGSTGLCKDGTYYSGDSKKGACRGHKGVKEWYAGAAATPAANDAAAPATEKKSRKSKKDAAAAAPAAAPAAIAAAAPAGSTGLCKDGTYYSGDSKKGACRGHKGVKEWYGAAAGAAAATPAKTSAPATPAAPPPAAAPKMSPAPTATAPAAAAPKAVPPMSTAPAAGGGAGKVWVNTESKVYHCADDRYYGKTKQGEYMSEADALAKGNHASHGKACTQ
jgi:hypothetical protein